jgi:protocatechuate 3,4-dioxygenase beta subunit
MKRIHLLAITCLLMASACQSPETVAQTQKPDRVVGGGCEGCELYLLGMPGNPTPETTIAGKDEPGERLTISGTIYQKDGRTPAEGIILYLYHTDATGRYSKGKKQSEATEHGRLRGWVKTGTDGKYLFHTILPASYPETKAPRHIHPTIKEPGLTPYYIDEYLFDNDPNLTEAERKKQPKRGGNGIISIKKNNTGEWMGQRDMVLGLNTPEYPK